MRKYWTQRVGNAGEHYAMSCLLMNDFDAALADRANPYFDILVRSSVLEYRSVRVKTTTGTRFQWTASAKLDPLPGFKRNKPDPRDISILIAFNDALPGIETDAFVIPTSQLVQDLNACYRHYHKFKKKNGEKRKQSSQRVIDIDGLERESNIAYGFREKWAEYLDAWHLLKN